MDNLLTYLRIAALMLTMWIGVPAHVTCQQDMSPYFFDGNEVVFVFDVRNYAAALHDEKGGKVDFEDLKIHDVAISGEFNDWNKKGWKMVRRSDFIFELRKPLTAFNDAYPKEFRYVVNGKYIADAEGVITDHAKFPDDFLRDVYKLDLSVLKPNAEGSERFFLEGFQDARKVILAGSFNGWDEQTTKMQKVQDGWSLKADLPPGRYEYKFIVDGTWLHDPRNRERVMNEHGTSNSVLWVTKPVQFKLEGFKGANTVILAGSFNNWNERSTKMFRVNDTWMISLDLPGGKHHYKFIVDGQWMTDPANPLVEDDGFGNMNSVLFVH